MMATEQDIDIEEQRKKFEKWFKSVLLKASDPMAHPGNTPTGVGKTFKCFRPYGAP